MNDDCETNEDEDRDLPYFGSPDQADEVIDMVIDQMCGGDRPQQLERSLDLYLHALQAITLEMSTQGHKAMKAGMPVEIVANVAMTKSRWLIDCMIGRIINLVHSDVFEWRGGNH